MTREEINELNAVIAIFRGAIEGTLEGQRIFKFPANRRMYENGGVYTLYTLKYDVSWDWLMPVFLQIATEAKIAIIQRTFCTIEHLSSSHDQQEKDLKNFSTTRREFNPLMSTFLAVTDYIKWVSKTLPFTAKKISSRESSRMTLTERIRQRQQNKGSSDD